jgi:hypothetical protein
MRLFHKEKKEKPDLAGILEIRIETNLDETRQEMRATFAKLSESFLFIAEGFANAADELAKEEK